MGLNVNGVGVIVVVCRNCGFKLYWYAIGDSSNRSKFSGPPTPSKAISGYDGGSCPLCGRKLSRKPSKLIFLTQKEFNERYVVGRYKLILRESVSKSTPTILSLEETVSGKFELQTMEA
mgnify:CR=1 FL=1